MKCALALLLVSTVAAGDLKTAVKRRLRKNSHDQGARDHGMPNQPDSTVMIINDSTDSPFGDHGMPNQPDSTVMIINDSTDSPFEVYLEFANYNLDGNGELLLEPPPNPWAIMENLSASGVSISAPTSFYPANVTCEKGVPACPQPKPAKCCNPFSTTAPPPLHNPNGVGSATWQILSMPSHGDIAVLKIPDFPKKQAWSVRPLKRNAAGNPCGGGLGGSEEECGKPILIEAGKEMVGDMSAVDGVNFLLRYELTTKDGPTVIDFKTNPCTATGQNPKGCVNPSIDGIFDPALVGQSTCLPLGSKHCWESAHCPAGTCNLAGKSKAWCDAINDGQCANSSSTWPKSGQGSGGPASCAQHNEYTTYCYSHNDATSSPYMGSPYQMKLTYRDLDAK